MTGSHLDRPLMLEGACDCDLFPRPLSPCLVLLAFVIVDVSDRQISHLTSTRKVIPYIFVPFSFIMKYILSLDYK